MQEIPGSNPGIFDFTFLSIFAQNSYCGKSPDNVFWTPYDLNLWPQWSKVDCKKFYVKWPSSPFDDKIPFYAQFYNFTKLLTNLAILNYVLHYDFQEFYLIFITFQSKIL